MADYREMWEIMSRHDFKTNSESNSTCILCNKLLIDAHHGPCGCTYCKCCVDKYIDGGGKACSGGTDRCAKEELRISNIFRDDCTNRVVSGLKVKCQLNLCDHECKLIDMCDHLRVCDKRVIMCPFSQMGCTVVTNQSEKLSKEVHHHDELLIEWMMNIKNDMTSLKASNPQNEIINADDLINSKISQMVAAYNGLHKENQVDTKITCAIDSLQIDIRDLLKKNELLTEADKEKEELIKQNKDFENPSRLNGKMDEMSNLKQTLQKPLIDQSTKNEVKLDTFSLPMKSIVSFVWNMDRSLLFGLISSDKYLSTDEKYRIKLKCDLVRHRVILSKFRKATKSPEESLKKIIKIKFKIKSAVSKQASKVESCWPCEIKITLAIFNQSNPSVRQVKTKNCKFSKKDKSANFNYSADDLITAEILDLNNLIAVECNVDQ